MSVGHQPNLFWRLMRSEKSSAAGHEDFVTEALGAVLGREPAITKHVFETLLKIDLGDPGDIAIGTQCGYTSPRVGASSIDLEVRSKNALIFVENKIEARLKKYAVLSDLDSAQHSINQVQKYDRVLAELGADYPIDRHLLVISQIPVEEQSAGLQHFRRSVLWWEIYERIEECLETGPEPMHMHDGSRWLAHEFLRFLHQAHLSPPRPLRQHRFNVRDGTRQLAEAIQNVGGFSRIGPMWAKNGFWVQREGKSYSISFTGQGELQIFASSVGALKPSAFDASFWKARSREQIRTLQGVVGGIPGLPRDTSARVNLESALSQFHKHPDLAEYLVTQICEHWPQVPKTGAGKSKVKEIRMAIGTFRAAVAPYARFERILLSVGSDRVEDADNFIRQSLPDLAAHLYTTREQINIPLFAVQSRDMADRLLEVFALLAERYQ